MVKKVQESKEKKATKAASAANKEKKKWTQGKAKEAVKRLVAVDEELFSKIEKDVAKATVVTSSSLAEKFNLNVGVAQKVLEHLCANGVIHCLSTTCRPKLYGRAQKAAPAAEKPAAAPEEVAAE
jgi:small subunit ribosomal protein S25e